MHLRDIARRIQGLFGSRAAAQRGSTQRPVRVLIVCMANVCRSPMACAVANSLMDRTMTGGSRHSGGEQRLAVFRSAGTHAEVSGERFDSRAKAVLARRGYGASNARSRRVAENDFEAFDLVLAMDKVNLSFLRAMCPPQHQHKLRLFLDYAPSHAGEEVPDPYYGDVAGFERVLDLCEAGVHGLIATLQAQSQSQKQ